MKRRLLAIGVGVGLAVSLGAFAQGQAAPAMVQVAGDNAITVTALPHAGTKVQWGRAVGVVAAPLADVVRTVEDYSQYYTFLPHFRTSRVLSQRGNVALVYMEATVALDTIKLWAQMKMGPAPSQGTTQVIEAKMVKGNMKILEARWELTPLGPNRTSVAFQLLMDPDAPLPASLLSNENAKASRKTIGALRKTVAARATISAQR